MFLGHFGFHKLCIQVVQYKLGLKEAIIVINNKLHSSLIFSFLFGFFLKLSQVTLHLSHACVLMHNTKICLCIEINTLYEDFVQVVALVLH